MADQKISELTAATVLSGADFAVLQSGVTKSLPASLITDLVPDADIGDMIVLTLNDAQSVNSTSDVAINWNDVRDGIKDASFTHAIGTNPSRVTLLNTGRYKIHVFMTVNGAGSNLRYTANTAVRVNGSTRRAPLLGGYIRYNGGSNDTVLQTLDVIAATANDYIEIVVKRISTTSGTVVTVADACILVIERVK